MNWLFKKWTGLVCFVRGHWTQPSEFYGFPVCRRCHLILRGPLKNWRVQQ